MQGVPKAAGYPALDFISGEDILFRAFPTWVSYCAVITSEERRSHPKTYDAITPWIWPAKRRLCVNEDHLQPVPYAVRISKHLKKGREGLQGSGRADQAAERHSASVNASLDTTDPGELLVLHRFQQHWPDHVPFVFAKYPDPDASHGHIRQYDLRYTVSWCLIRRSSEDTYAGLG
jgi:hypothetical protein